MAGRITLRPDSDNMDGRYSVSFKEGIQRNQDPGAVQSYEVRKIIKQNKESIEASNIKIWISFAVEFVALAIIIAMWISLSKQGP